MSLAREHHAPVGNASSSRAASNEKQVQKETVPAADVSTDYKFTLAMQRRGLAMEMAKIPLLVAFMF